MKSFDYNIKRIFQNAEINDSTPGYAVGIYLNRKEYFFCQGMSSLEMSTPISIDTKFHLASLTKRFTAILFRILEKDGYISEHDKVSNIFPLAILEKNAITFKQLLDHSSGLRDQWDLTELAGWDSSDSISNSDIIDLLSSQHDLNFSPGKFYSYCNTGYTLIALAIEKVMNENIQILIEKYITQSLDLKSTGYYSYKDTSLNIAPAYKLANDKKFVVNIPSFDVIGSTSMFSSIRDMIAFERETHLKNPFPKKGIILQDKSKINNSFYHDGLIFSSFTGSQIEFHSGWDYGYSSFLVRLNDLQASIVILANFGVPKLFNYAFKIASLLDPKVDSIALPKDSHFQYERNINQGYFFNPESNFIVRLHHNKNSLLLNDEALIHISKKKFRVDNSLNTLEIINSTVFSLNILGSIHKYSYLNLNKIDLEKIRPYIGRYYSEELDKFYTLIIQEDILTIKIDYKSKWILTPITYEYFRCDRFTLKFNLENGCPTSFTISTLRSWNIYFRKID